MHRFPGFLLISSLLLALALAQAAGAQVQVRVLLDQTETIDVLVAEGHRGVLDGQPRFHTALPLNWPLSASGDWLQIDGQAVGHSFSLETDSGLVTWSGQTYRGAITFVARDSRLLVINTLDLEDYLRGVVPAEMQASWPLEALKAQAIAARSYVLNSLAPMADFDICATQDCQVYRGTALEHAGSDAAILATSGLVLTHHGNFARTYYHSDSGGVLASSSEVWGEAYPYLQARPDVLADSPHRQWQLQLDSAAVTRAARAAGFEIGTATALSVLAYSDSGRVSGLLVLGTAGSGTLQGTQVNSFLRGLGLKSTRLVMTGPLSARGDGWGHGVGMSQYGALSLAEAGYAYDQILSFYYPSTELSRLSVLGSTF